MYFFFTRDVWCLIHKMRNMPPTSSSSILNREAAPLTWTLEFEAHVRLLKSTCILMKLLLRVILIVNMSLYYSRYWTSHRLFSEIWNCCCFLTVRVLLSPSVNQRVTISLSCGTRVISHMAFTAQVIDSVCVQSAHQQKHTLLPSHFPFHSIYYYYFAIIGSSIQCEALGQAVWKMNGFILLQLNT